MANAVFNPDGSAVLEGEAGTLHFLDGRVKHVAPGWFINEDFAAALGDRLRLDVDVPDTPEGHVRTGWTHDGEALQVVSELPPPPTISRRQMLIVLNQAGLMTDEETTAAATTGAAPAVLETLIAGMTAPEQVAARVTWATMTQCEPDHPLAIALSAIEGLTTEQRHALFRAAASI